MQWRALDGNTPGEKWWRKVITGHGANPYTSSPSYLSVVYTATVVDFVHVIFLASVCGCNARRDLRLCGMHRVPNGLLY